MTEIYMAVIVMLTIFLVAAVVILIQLDRENKNLNSLLVEYMNSLRHIDGLFEDKGRRKDD